MKQASIFEEIADVPKDPIFGLQDAYQGDKRPNKIDLTVGVYLEEDGALPGIFRSVKLAERELVETETTKSYLPIDGDPEFVDLTGKFIFGDLYTSNIYGAQTIGGTAALRLLGDFIKRGVADNISISNPSWPNHAQVFRKVGLETEAYPYWNGGFDFQRLVEYLSQLPPKTVVLLQPACHNPTGWDLTMEEWHLLSDLFHNKGLIPFFDSAYQGLGKGVEQDTAAIRHFVSRGHDCFVAHSFAKSMALYSERVGALFVVMNDAKYKDTIKRNVSSLIRTHYSNPSKHGSEIAKLLFKKPELNRIWREELEKIRLQIVRTRALFAKKLQDRTGKSYEMIRGGNGFFSVLGLNKGQVELLRDNYAIYMTAASRINLAAINAKNIDYVVDAIAAVLQ